MYSTSFYSIPFCLHRIFSPTLFVSRPPYLKSLRFPTGFSMKDEPAANRVYALPHGIGTDSKSDQRQRLQF
ncbi:hypothetical protein PanWU01x14_102960 [Parasponia andersonii]|uniref:Uncharacterized protein n=1 Tax=Parasponia andersonii TaxID=3476 RepID=A0A2P5D2G4_PARAD|nr:hypothetical protein PanWU01x14_102960 [Parasponia andersonii]